MQKNKQKQMEADGLQQTQAEQEAIGKQKKIPATKEKKNKKKKNG